MTSQTLYERLGGVNAIAMVVGRFSDEIVKNPKLNENSTLNEWNKTSKLAGLKFMRTLGLCQQAGGPFQSTRKELGEAHAHLHIIPGEFDEVGAEIAAPQIPTGRARLAHRHRVPPTHFTLALSISCWTLDLLSPVASEIFP